MTKPPATGSIELLAVTVATSGSGNTAPAVWPLPEVTAMVNPLDSKAPISTVPLTMRVASAALVGGDAGGNEGVIARVDRRAAGQLGHRLGRPAVVTQGSEHRVGHADDVAVDPVYLSLPGSPSRSGCCCPTSYQ